MSLEIVDQVMDMDIAFFKNNPKKSDYVRPYVPGEIYPLCDKCCGYNYVRVEQIRPGLRLRHPFFSAVVVEQ